MANAHLWGEVVASMYVWMEVSSALVLGALVLSAGVDSTHVWGVGVLVCNCGVKLWPGVSSAHMLGVGVYSAHVWGLGLASVHMWGAVGVE